MSRDTFPFDPHYDSDFLDREGDTRAASRCAQIRQPEEVCGLARFDSRKDPRLEPHREGSPRAHLLRDRAFLLRDSELQTLADLGTFRLVAVADLARSAYGGDAARMERDLRRLKRKRLLAECTLPISGRKILRVVGLTKIGKRLLRSANRVPENQALYHGIVKPREAEHDAELYQLFHAESARIENAGGRSLRVILDYELKRDLNRERALLGERGDDPKEIARLAKAHGLTVVDGKIPLPDMRIEYQDAELELHRIDLELATRHYRPQGLAQKAQAGFSLYSKRDDVPRLRRILDEQKLRARIFSL